VLGDYWETIMRITSTKHFSVLLILAAMFYCRAEAHVKWFLDRPENEILAQAKPDLFTQLSVWNVLPILIALSFTLACVFLNKHFASHPFHKRLSSFAGKQEPAINLVMAISLGASLIYCATTKLLLVPNFIICSHCPWYLPHVEFLIGAGLILGLCSRFCALALFGLLLFAWMKHGTAECLDLLPYYGLATYFLIAGRNRLSLDYICSIDRQIGSAVFELSHLIVRSSMALGLVILAFDEKLLHPQLALALLKCEPQLNFVQGLGVSNEMFTLCGGLGELILGSLLFLGIFPRLVMIALALLFAVTTVIFGYREFFGHALFYGIVFSTILRGAGVLSPTTALWYLVKEQNGGFRRTLFPIKNTEEALAGASVAQGTLKYLLPARKTNSMLAKERHFILSSKLAKDMQTDTQIALAS
jgi:uncharacterized membrane protein YphA (DoxX/SURF4 family)